MNKVSSLILILMISNLVCGQGWDWSWPRWDEVFEDNESSGGWHNNGSRWDELTNSNNSEYEDFKLSSFKVDFKVNEVFGYCNTTRLNNLEINGFGECAGNFLNPSFPNPFFIVEPITGDELKKKITLINIFDFDLISSFNLSELISRIVNIPVILFFSLLQILANSISFLIKFMIKFLFVYIFYISLGFQTLIYVIDRNANSMTSLNKIYATIGFMFLATIITLGGGLNWF